MFTPVKVGSIVSPNAIMASSVYLGLNESMENPIPTPALVHHYKEMAKGGVGFILCEHTAVDSKFGSASGRQLVIDDDKFIQPHQQFVEEVKAAGEEAGNDLLFVIQLAHAGGQTVNPEGFVPSASVDFTPFPLKNKIEPTDEEVKERIIKKFVEAAVRAAKAGYDGVQIHGAHGYMVSEFVNKKFNQRPATSRYRGDTIEGRAQLPIDIANEIREAVKDYPNFVVGIKINSADFQEGGNTFEDAAAIIEQLVTKAQLDFVELSGGSPWAENGNIPIRKGRFVGPEKEAWYLEGAKMIREKTKGKTTLAMVGGMRSRQYCEKILGDDVVDMISFGRPLICEPDLPNKMKADENAVSTCVGCQHCIGSVSRPEQPPTGALNCPIRNKKGLNVAIEELLA